MTVVHRVTPRAFALTAPLLVAVALYTHAVFVFAQPQEEAICSTEMETPSCVPETAESLAGESMPANIASDPPGSEAVGSISALSITDETATCPPDAFLGQWALESGYFLLNNQTYWGSYYNGTADNVLNYCTGTPFWSTTYAAVGDYWTCYACQFYVDLLYQAWQCGYYRVIGRNYLCNDSFVGDIHKKFLDYPWQYRETATWYKVAPSITVRMTDATDYEGAWYGYAMMGADGQPTPITPVRDRPGGTHNKPIFVFNFEVVSAIATNVKVETTYDGTGAGHAHGGRPLRDYDLTQANQLGALFNGPTRTGGLAGTVLTLRLAPGVSRRFSYQATGFAGVETVRITFNDNLPAHRRTETHTIIAEVTGLQELAEDYYWVKYGVLPAHPRSHYGTGPFNGFVDRFAFWYYSWTGGGNGGNPERFRYNDMSLVKGGPFEWEGQWNNSVRHQMHREGRSLDLDELACRPWYSDSDCQTRDRSSEALKPLDLWVAINAWDRARIENPYVSNPTYDYEDGLHHYHIQAD